MRKTFLTVVLISALIFTAFNAAVLAKEGGDRDRGKSENSTFLSNSMMKSLFMGMKNRHSVNITLNNTVGTSVTGTAKIDAILKKNKVYDTSLSLTVKGKPADNMLYEGWLTDNESGYKLSLGTFKTENDGSNSVLSFRQMLVNLSIYDKLVVTQEPIADTNPSPGTTVLSGDLPGDLATVVMRANLNGASEVPSTNSSATGKGWFIVNPKDNTIKYEITYKNLGGVETGAHIHGFALKGSSAGILFALPSGSTKKGTLTYNENQEADILAGGRMYVNIHSDKFPNGEIRGQIVF